MRVAKHDARPRRFGLGDTLILIVALAVAFPFSGLILEPFMGWEFQELWTIHPGESWKDHAVTLVMLFGKMPIGPAFLGSATVLAMRFRSPRPRFARLARQPGFMACVVVLLTLAAGAVPLAEYNFLFRTMGGHQEPLLNPGKLFLALLYLMAVPVGFAVMASWFTLVLARRWRPEPMWLDRAGRFFGWLWILLALANGPSLFQQLLGMAIE